MAGKLNSALFSFGVRENCAFRLWERELGVARDMIVRGVTKLKIKSTLGLGYNIKSKKG